MISQFNHIEFVRLICQEICYFFKISYLPFDDRCDIFVTWELTFELTLFRRVARASRLACMQQTLWHSCIDFLTYSRRSPMPAVWFMSEWRVVTNRDQAGKENMWIYRSLPAVLKWLRSSKGYRLIRETHSDIQHFPNLFVIKKISLLNNSTINNFTTFLWWWFHNCYTNSLKSILQHYLWKQLTIHHLQYSNQRTMPAEF